MSYGLLCLASDIPPNREVGLKEEQYFKPGDYTELSTKLNTFTNRILSLEESSVQVKLLEERYNWDTIAQETFKVYRQVLAGIP